MERCKCQPWGLVRTHSLLGCELSCTSACRSILKQSGVPAAISTLVTAVEILKNGNWAVETSALLAGLPSVKDPAPRLRGAARWRRDHLQILSEEQACW